MTLKNSRHCKGKEGKLRRQLQRKNNTGNGNAEQASDLHIHNILISRNQLVAHLHHGLE
jgi:hypothetical protein